MKRRRSRKFRKPDDYFASGPFEFARFGRTMLSRSRATEEQWRAAQDRLADSLPEVILATDATVARIAGRVAGLPAARLLQRAWWEAAMAVTGFAGATAPDPDDPIVRRMIDYVQSVVASVKPRDSISEDVSESEWAALKEDVRDLFTRLSLEYQFARTAHSRRQDPDLDMALEEFRFRAESHWLNVRGQRYHVHEGRALLDVLEPHSDVLQRLFGVGAKALVEELGRILTKQIRGLADALEQMHQLMEDFWRPLGLEGNSGSGPEADVFRRRLSQDAEYSGRCEKVAGEVVGLDLFDIGKVANLPDRLVQALAWSPGEEEEFFAPGDFRGWPLRVWPTMRRPFIRLDGRVLCFDIFSLFDNIYRVIQRTIARLEPSYKDTWNERQKMVSEALPFTYLSQILKGARVIRPVYYRWKAGSGPLQWCETDGVLTYDDHLLVIEVKAGAFTYTSPATDLPAQIASLKNLVLSPASQGARFLDYLDSAPEVPIFDAEHTEVGRLRRSDFRHATICAVTLDAFTALAARSQHLRKVGIDVGSRAVWSISIDDIRVFADLFDNPLVFLHFVEQRMRAAGNDVVDVIDEMDHLGLYFAQNNYSQYADELVGGRDRQAQLLAFNGFSEKIDAYYGSLVREDVTVRPEQEIPDRLREIVTFLAHSEIPHRSALASFLLDAAGDFRKALAKAIDDALRDNRLLGRVRPYSTFGGVSLTLCVWSPAAPRRAALALEHTETVIAAHDEMTRLLVELEYTERDVLEAVHWQHVTLALLSNQARSRIVAAAAALKRQRVNSVSSVRKIGPNEKCPCGSGRKYKRCCRP